MKYVLAVIGATLLLGTSGAFAQQAPAGHEQHQHAAKQEAATDGCCCEKHMKEMMSMMHDMMKMHPGTMQQGMKMPTDGKSTPAPNEHKH